MQESVNFVNIDLFKVTKFLTGNKVLSSFPLLLTIIPSMFTIIWPYEKKLSSTKDSFFNTKQFKRIIAALGFSGWASTHFRQFESRVGRLIMLALEFPEIAL